MQQYPSGKGLAATRDVSLISLDYRETLIHSEFGEGGMIGPAPAPGQPAGVCPMY